MEVVINGKNLDLDLKNTVTFKDVMDRVTQHVLFQNAVITRVAVNGEYISEERERDLGVLKKEDIASIEVEAKNPLDLAHETMLSGLDYLPRLTEALRMNAKSFRLQDSKAFRDDFHACVEGLQWFYSMIQGLKGPLHIADDEVIVDQKTYAQLQEEAASALNEICDAREANNHVGMAEAIEYELVPNLEIWRQWLVKCTDLDAALKKFNS